MIYGITYTDSNMTISAEKCRLSMEKNGFDDAKIFTESDIDFDFKLTNSEIFNSERGAGCYWLFKPYVINRMIRTIQDGSYLIYSDAGVEFIAPVQQIINRMDEDIFFFTNGWLHKEWCKADVMKAINGWHVYDNFNQTQIQASVIFFRVCQKTRDFVKEWLLWCQMPGFIDDSPSRHPNCPTFAEHRHDQSVICSLAIKHGYTIDHWWPTQYSMHLVRSDRDSYPAMFNHHRKRNNEW